ncbi:MAG TPA: RluA family pseudouridine synthase [Polyangiaceae bacterium]|nr:RluA family pseudouridine synthase [Polyangiaceae bacterium]
MGGKPRDPSPECESVESKPTRPPGVGEDAILRVLRVPPESAGMRVDVFLQSQLRGTSRTRARAIIENSAFTPEGRRLRASDRLRAEQRVVLWRPALDEQTDGPPLPILYEDPHLLVVDKPPLMAVHPTARYHRSTVIKRLAQERPGEFLSLVHRIDRETSGLLLVARSPQAERAFKRLLEDRSMAEMARADPALAFTRSESERRALLERARRAAPMGKTYLAITWGVPAVTAIDVPLELDPNNPLRVKMRVAERGGGLDARTAVEVLEERAGYGLVACELHTGRQHQIRVHLSSIGCPIVGDKLYGPDERLLARAADGELDDADRAKLELPRHALHAHRYTLTHPLTLERLELVSPLPEDLAEFWRGLLLRSDAADAPDRTH